MEPNRSGPSRKASEPTTFGALMSACLKDLQTHDIDAASLKCLAWLDTTDAPIIDLELVMSMIHMSAYLRNMVSPAYRKLVVRAAQLGCKKDAYNVGCHLGHHSSGAVQHHQACEVFKVAMADDSVPYAHAAAHVNYAHHLERANPGDQAVYVQAVELCGKAGRLGMIRGALHAGHASLKLYRQGQASFGAEAAKWFSLAIDLYERKAYLDSVMDDAKSLVDIARCELGGCHIDGRFDGADLDTGLRIVSDLADAGMEPARDYQKVGISHKISRLTTPPDRQHAGANWRTVLSAMGWTFEDSMLTEHLACETTEGTEHRFQVDVLHVSGGNKSICPLIVCNVLPGSNQAERNICKAVVQRFARENPRFIMVFRRAKFCRRGLHHFLPIHVWTGSALSIQTLELCVTPQEILGRASREAKFLSDRYSDPHTVLAFALAALDDGCVLGDVMLRGSMGVIELGEGYFLPVHDEASVEFVAAQSI